MAKKKAKKADKKKGKKEKKSKDKKKSKDGDAKPVAPPPSAQQLPPSHNPPLGLGYTWTMEDDFLTGQIFEHFSKGRGTMNASEFGEALKSMGFGQPAQQPRQCFPQLRMQQQQPQIQANNTIDNFSSTSNISSDMFQNGYLSLAPWWITNDKLVGNKYQGADLAIAEARRRRKFTERAMNELTLMRRR